MATLKEQFALRERLQAVEADLLAAGKRHVTIRGVEGVFEWYAIDADREPAEHTQADDVQEIEDMLVAEGAKPVTVATAGGTFCWRPARQSPEGL